VTQAGFFALVYAVGLAFHLGIGPRRDALLSCALAFPCGLAIWVGGALAGLATGWGSPSRVGVGVLVATGLTSVGAAFRRRGSPWPSWRLLAAATAFFLAAVVVLGQFSLAKLSPDSRQIIRLATVFARGGSLDETTGFFLADRGVFTFLSYAGAELCGVDFMYALAPVLALSSVALFAVASMRALTGEGVSPPLARLAAAGVTAAVMSTYVVAYHMVYIHSNFGSALYLFGFAALFWLAERDRDPSLLAPAFVCLVAFSLHRVEAALFAALFAALAAWPSRLPPRLLAGGLALFGAVVAGWLLRLGAAIPSTSDFLTPVRSIALSLAALTPLIAWPLVRRLPVRIRDCHLPYSLLIATAIGLALAFALKPGHMASSTYALAVNLLGVHGLLWGYTWWAALALAGLSLATPPLRVGRPLFLALPAALILVILLSFLRPPYRIGLADSGSRMFIHFAPLLYFLYTLKFVPLFKPRAADAEAPR